MSVAEANDDFATLQELNRNYIRAAAEPDLREDDVVIHMLGDTAINYARTTYGKPDGRQGTGRYTDAWQLRHGRWLCVFANVSRG